MRLASSYVIVVIIQTVFFTSIYYQSAEEPDLSFYQEKVERLERFIQIDNERKYSFKKIRTIIDQYNSRMDEDLKEEIVQIIFEMTIKYPILDLDLICATITHESAKTWSPIIMSPVGAIGLMQIMPYTGKMLSNEEGLLWTVDNLYDPIVNIKLGCRYLSGMIELYDIDGGLAAYNGGPRRASNWIRSNRNNNYLMAETRKYIPYVLGYYENFKEMKL